jgi:hypothetical protein
MTRTFNDKEFRMIGAIQSFYYRCWSTFGGGRETPRRIGQTEIDLINRWGYNLFNDLSVHDYRIEVIDENVLEAGERLYVNLVINPHIGLDFFIYEVDIRIPNLSDLDIYNVRWVEGDYTGPEEVSPSGENYVIKKVPKVFKTK